MATDLPLRCSCGELRGTLHADPERGSRRLVCYCDDCQAFAHFLGRADEILDLHGGTEVFQTSPARLSFGQGADRLACMRLTEKGLLRWYARCCETPVGNTLATSQVPFVGLVDRCVDHAAAGRPRDETLGPIRARIQGRFARGDRTGLDIHDTAPLGVLASGAWALAKARLRGDHRRSPFFDPETGRPIVSPHVLGAEERARVEAARDAS